MEEVSSPDKEMVRVTLSSFQMIDDWLLPAALWFACLSTPLNDWFFLHILTLPFLFWFRFDLRLRWGQLCSVKKIKSNYSGHKRQLFNNTPAAALLSLTSSSLGSGRYWSPSTRSGSGCPARRTRRPTPSDPTCDRWAWPRPLCCPTWSTWRTGTGTWPSTTAFRIPTSLWWSCCWTPVSKCSLRTSAANLDVWGYLPPPPVSRSVWDWQHEQGRLHAGDAGRADGCRQPRRPGGGAAAAKARQRQRLLTTGRTAGWGSWPRPPWRTFQISCVRLWFQA